MNAALSTRTRRRLQRNGPLVLAVAAGGALGSLLRFEAGLIWPTGPGAFPTTTLLINLTGCLVIGLFLVVITEVWTPHHLLRPFFGTGVLGGFTTFSTYSLDIVTLFRQGHAAAAMLYLGVTAVGALLAVALGMLLARLLLSSRRST